MDNTEAMSIERANAAEHAKHGDSIKKALLKAFWILLAVTIVEIGLALLHYEANFLPRGVLNAVFIILTIVKAYYIVAIFMHLHSEKKHLALIILLPLLFLIWGIGALLWEGGATKNARQDNRGVIETTIPWENVRHETH